MSNVSAEIKVFPGKEMMALDMAEVLDASTIGSGIIAGCQIPTPSNGKLTIDSGRIIIRGRLGVITGGEIPIPTLTGDADCKVLAICDLSSDTPFSIRMVNNAEYQALEAAKNNTPTNFNSGNGVDFVELGVAHVNSATGNVTSWTPTNAEPKHDSDRLAEAVASANASHTLLTEKINAWATYLQKRAFGWSPQFAIVTLHAPSYTLAAGARLGCTFPAIRNSTCTAAGPNSRTESIPQIPTFEQQYTTLSDGTQIPLNIDEDPLRYVAAGISRVLISNAKYKVGNKEVGKNYNNCTIAGWGLYGSERQRRCVIYLRNVGTEEAIVDLEVDLLFVRRG